jgi:hypothetical protein
MKEPIHRRARDGSALAREFLLQSIDRKMVSALGDGDVREEASAVLPLLYDLRRARCGDDAATASTAQDLLHMLDAHELRGHELPHARDLASPSGVRSVRPHAVQRRRASGTLWSTRKVSVCALASARACRVAFACAAVAGSPVFTRGIFDRSLRVP